MTEGYQPPAAAGRQGNQDNDTTAFPKVTPQKPPVWTPGASDAWAAPSASGSSPGSAGSSSGSSASSNDGSSSFGGIGARLTAAKEAMRGAADAAEAKAGPADATTTTVAAVTSSGRGGGAGRSASRAARSTSRQPRKARLTLSHINVYSVFKFSCVLAIALFFVWLIMVGVLYGALDVSGALGQVNKAVRTVTGNDNAKDVVTGSLVFGSAIIIGAVNIVLFIAISTIGAMIYNLCADLVGGTEVTLSERE
jgi:hypothetical protein